MSFEKQMEEWISLDNQIKLLNDKIKHIRDKKNGITKNILSYVEVNNLANSNIKTTDGHVKIVNTSISPPITFKYLEKCLLEIIKNESQVTKIIEYIKQRRDIKHSFEIKRFINN